MTNAAPYAWVPAPILAASLWLSACGGGPSAVASTTPPATGMSSARQTGAGTPSSDERACRSAGDAQTCLALGRRYELARGVDRSVPRALELYRLACEQGLGAGCFAWLALIDANSYFWEQREPALAASVAACESDSADACAAVGFAHDKGLGVDVDYATALRWYQSSCASGSTRGCTGLADLYWSGDGVESDPQRAVQLYTQSCAADDPWACSQLGHIYDEGEVVPQDYVRARELYERACEGGDPLGCSNWGVLMLEGMGVTPSAERAAQLFERGCREGDAGGCNELALLYERGLGVPRDLALARELFLEACMGYIAEGCEGQARLDGDETEDPGEGD